MLLAFAIASVFLALIFYATSVSQELIKKKVTALILAFFWLGFFFDVAGTLLMSVIAKGFHLNLHSVSGLIALFSMGIKAIWSSINYGRGLGERIPTSYTVFSSFLWIAVFILGIFMAR